MGSKKSHEFYNILVNTTIKEYNRIKNSSLTVKRLQKPDKEYILLLKNVFKTVMEDIKIDYKSLRHNLTSMQFGVLEQYKNKCDKFVFELHGHLEDLLFYYEIGVCVESEEIYKLIKDIKKYIEDVIPVIDEEQINYCKKKERKILKMLKRDICGYHRVELDEFDFDYIDSCIKCKKEEMDEEQNDDTH